jgi:hypothetical protein
MATCKCGEINEYQEEPYVCRNCRLTTGPVLEGGKIFTGPSIKSMLDTPSARAAMVRDMVEAGMLPDIVAPEVAKREAVEAEMVAFVMSTIEGESYMIGQDRFRTFFNRAQELAKRLYAILNPGAKSEAEAAAKAYGEASKRYMKAISSLPFEVRKELEDIADKAST